jgi:hypothetical protein
MGKKDIVIGIPALDEEATIIHVLSMVSMGLQEFYPEYKSRLSRPLVTKVRVAL